MQANGARAFALMEKMGFTRLSGTEEELRAAQILLDTLSQAGVSGTLEAFEVEDGEVLQAELTVLAPYEKSYRVTGYKCAASTLEEGLTAPLLYVGDPSEVSMADAKGKIVLINGRMTVDNYIQVRRAGAAGFLTMCGTLTDPEDKRDIDTRKLRPTLTQYGVIPGLNLHITDAMELVQRGASLARLKLRTERKTRTSHNVLADIPGTKYPEQILAIGAHYDSVEFSSGVYDNAAGSAVIMELLYHFLQNPPARTLRFIWFGSEEQGLLGSKAHLHLHENELEKYRFMLNLDVGAITLGHNLSVVSANESLTHVVDFLSHELGYPLEIRHDIMSSDSSSFNDRGIPAVSFGRGGTRGAEFMHTRYDCIEFQCAQALEDSANFAGAFAGHLANAAVFPVAREIPDELVKKLEKYFHKNPVKL